MKYVEQNNRICEWKNETRAVAVLVYRIGLLYRKAKDLLLEFEPKPWL